MARITLLALVAVAASAQTPDWPKVNAETLRHYTAVVQMDTTDPPGNETKVVDYVKKVLANAMFYQAQLGLPYVALRERLGVVAPRGSSGASSEVAAIPAEDRPKEAP